MRVPKKARRASVLAVKVELGILADHMRADHVTTSFVLAGLQEVDVYRSVAALRCKELIEGIPGDTLNVMTVL